MTLNEAAAVLDTTEKALYALAHAQDILYVDGETVAPKQSWRARGEALGYLSELQYQKLTSPETAEAVRTILDRGDQADPVVFRRAEVLKENLDEMNVLPLEEFLAYHRMIDISASIAMECDVAFQSEMDTNIPISQ